jgi:transposase-like protein
MDSTPFPSSLLEAIRYFEDDERCRDFVADLRWPDGVECPREGCGSTSVQFISTRGIWRCKTCKRQFSVKVGTIFEDSPIPLGKWLTALWMLTSRKKGVSSYQMARDLDVTQKTAWFMDHRLRLAMKTQSFLKPMTGEVEADETFIGGKETNKHTNKRIIKTHPGGKRGGGTEGKAIVMGMLERETGQFRATIVPSTRKHHLQAQVRDNVAPGATLYTDAHGSYRGLAGEYKHDVVDHAAEYVRGRVHVNGVENFWSLLKRGLTGIYHSVEVEHLDRYLDEFTYRYNTRAATDAQRFASSVPRISGKRLTYAELTSKG